MKSKTTISKQAKRKLNTEVVETILHAKKNEKWLQVARMLTMPRTKKIAINLDEIEKHSKEGDTIVVPGKILGQGDLSKRIRLVALAFSAQAEKKLKDKKSEIVTIAQEIKINPKAQGVKILA